MVTSNQDISFRYNIPVKNKFQMLESSVEIPTLPVSSLDMIQGLVRPLALGKYRTFHFVIFFDSGAPTNLVSLEVYNKYFNHVELLQDNETPPLADINGGPLKVKGKILLTFELAGTSITEEVIVAENVSLAGHILIGFPAMVRNQIILDTSRNGVTVNGNLVEFYKPVVFSSYNISTVPKVQFKSNEIPKQSKPKPCTVANINMSLEQRLGLNTVQSINLRKRIRLKAGQTAYVKCKVSHKIMDSYAITLPEEEKVKGLTVESSLHQIKDNLLIIQVTNNRDSNVNLGKGTCVCKVEIYADEIKEVDDKVNVISNVSSVTEQAKDLKKRRIVEQINNVDFHEYKTRLVDLLMKYNQIVAVKGDPLGVTDRIKHHIAIKRDIDPIFIPAYRVPYSQKEIIEQEVEKMLSQGIVEPSNSPWSFPLLVVPKKDGSNRVVVDFRRLNENTITDPYPMPSMRDLLSTIGENTVFSVIDLLQGFHQIELTEDSKELTAFNTSQGHYQYCRMPFGLKSSPVTFVRLIDNVFRGLLGKAVIAYIDDLIILGKTMEEHFQNLELVLERLQEANLKLKLSKCSFLKREVSYLGHKISKKGVEVTQEKVESIINFPTPTNKKQVKSFLGLSGFYRMFISNFAQIASPMTDLLKKDSLFLWGDSQEKAFQALKQALITSPVLILPDFTKEFYLATDASDIGIGSCLMQYGDSDRLQVIAYYSRKLNEAERKYSVTDKESLAVIESLKHFRFIIYGHKTIVMTDHSAIKYIFNNPNHSGRRARWFIIAADYDVSFKFIAGKTNKVADSLSRNFPSENVSHVRQNEALDEKMIAIHQDADNEIKRIKDFISDRQGNDKEETFIIPVDNLRLVDNLLVRDEINTNKDMCEDSFVQIIIPMSLKDRVLKMTHDDRGHPGRDETLRQAKMRYFWKTMYKDVEEYVSTCHECALHKGTSAKAPMNSFPIAQQPFERVAIDILTNLSTTPNGFKHILICVDALTRFVELIPLKSKTALECATAFHQDFILRYTSPDILISDNGLEFNNKFMSELCDIYETKKVNILPYHPASNGLAERAIRKLLDVMRQIITNNDPHWDIRLNTIQYILNTSIHQSIKMSPFKALFGITPRTPLESNHSTLVRYKEENPIQARMENFKMYRNKIQRCLKEANIVMKENQHKRATERNFEIGDIVYVKRDVITGPNYKLIPKFNGPYVIIECKFGNKYLVKHLKDKTTKLTHADKMKLRRLRDNEMDDMTEDEDMSDSEDDDNVQMSSDTRQSERLRNKARLNYQEI